MQNAYLFSGINKNITGFTEISSHLFVTEKPILSNTLAIHGLRSKWTHFCMLVFRPFHAHLQKCIF